MESAGKCPTIAPGGGWALLELTDALHHPSTLLPWILQTAEESPKRGKTAENA